MSTYRAIWPITDPRIALADLISQAEHDLGQMLTAENHLPNGSPQWHIVRRNGLKLAVDIPVQPKGKPSPECGSEPGYKRHQRNGEAPCDDCREAASMVRQIRRLRAVKGATG